MRGTYHWYIFNRDLGYANEEMDGGLGSGCGWLRECLGGVFVVAECAVVFGYWYCGSAVGFAVDVFECYL